MLATKSPWFLLWNSRHKRDNFVDTKMMAWIFILLKICSFIHFALQSPVRMHRVLYYSYGASTQVIIHIQVEKLETRLGDIAFLFSVQYLWLFLNQNLLHTFNSVQSGLFLSAYSPEEREEWETLWLDGDTLNLIKNGFSEAIWDFILLSLLTLDLLRFARLLAPLTSITHNRWVLVLNLCLLCPLPSWLKFYKPIFFGIFFSHLPGASLFLSFSSASLHLLCPGQNPQYLLSFSVILSTYRMTQYKFIFEIT